MAGKSHYSIKPFHPPLGPDDGVPLVLAAEVRVLARIDHPNVIRPVTIGESSDGHHLVMEYVEGTSFEEIRQRTWRRGRELPLGVTVRIVLDALAGLAAVHELTDESGRPLGLVHRGMSPSSVLVGVDGVARVANLGVERRMSYMDAMRKRHLDRRAELFAVGVMLWEGAANRRLFEPESDGDHLGRVAQHTAPRLDAVASGVPRGIAAVCARALDPDVSWRYPSAAALAEALEGAALDSDALADHAGVARFAAELEAAAAAAPDTAVTRRRVFAAGTTAGQEVVDGDPRGQRPPVPRPRPTSDPGTPGGGRPVQFGKYRVVRYLAEGGMAEVYLASTTGIEGFEHVHGQDLRMVLRRARRRGTRLPLEVAVRIVAELCGALHHAHEKCDADRVPLGLVHRDVSPSNVLISYDGAVKLCDFGIAEVTARSDERKRTRAGKLSYMSPEQCRGDLLDRRSDLFVLAVVLYELTTMTKLFKGASEREVMQSVVEGRVRPPSEVSPGYPRELERIVMKSLSVDPAARHATALEMMLELEELGREHKLAMSSVAVARVMEELFPPPERDGPAAPGDALDPGSDLDGEEIVEVRPPRPWYRGWLAALALAVAVIAATVAAVNARRAAAAELVTGSRAAARRMAERLSAGPVDLRSDAALRAALAGELPRGLLAASLRGLDREVVLLAPAGGAARGVRVEIPLPRDGRAPPLSLAVARPPIDIGRLLLARWIAIGFALACLVLYLDGHRRHRWWRRRV